MKGIGQSMKNFAPGRANLALRSRGNYLRAVEARDAGLDGAFVYAVRSTGIYCRPSCPSRRPHPRQVVLFAVPEAAEHAGFRACRRCHPDRAQRDAKSDLVRRVCVEIAADANSATIQGDHGGKSVSAHHLQRTFRKAMGITPRQYADAIRIARLKSDLRKGTDVTTAL